ESEPRLPLYLRSDAAATDTSPEGDVPLERVAARYEDVDVSPVLSPRHAAGDEAPVAPPAGLITGHESSPASVELDRARSAVWPLVLALTVGLAMGFAGGYGVGSHDRSQPPAATGREFTENPVEAPKESSARLQPDPRAAQAESPARLKADTM